MTSLPILPLSFSDADVTSGHASFDFARVFDNEVDLNTKDLFSGGPSSNCGNNDEPFSFLSTMMDQQQQQPMQVQSSHGASATAPLATAAPQQHQSNNHADNPFVNIVMVVDPVTNKVVCPQQVITYVTPDGKIEKTVFGPITLDSVADLQQATAQAQGTTPDTTEAAAHQVSPNPYNFQPIAPASSLQAAAAAVPAVAAGRVSPSDSSLGSINADNNITTTAATDKKKSQQEQELPPLRALSAYNFFFRDERDRILNGGEQEFTPTKEMLLLRAHWNTDRTKKRRHRKTHGKISFTTLSKVISQRWKSLDLSQKDFYRQVASKDWERYQKELAEYKKTNEARTCANAGATATGSSIASLS